MVKEKASDLLLKVGGWRGVLAAGTFVGALLLTVAQTVDHESRVKQLEAWKTEMQDSLRSVSMFQVSINNMAVKVDNIETLLWCQVTSATVCPASPPTPPTRRDFR